MTLLPRFRCSRFVLFLLLAGTLGFAAAAQDKAAPAPDILVLNNGDTLHGKFVMAVNGNVTFHSDPLGDLTIGWDKIKEVHTSASFAILTTEDKARGKKAAAALPEGKLDVAGGTVTVQSKTQPAPAPIPVKNAQFVVDRATLDKQLYHNPGFFTGWNGSATAGATIVTGTQNQYSVAGSAGLVRVVPTVTWLDPRNRTSADFASSFGKITQPSYVSGGVFFPSIVTKTSILHFDAERDEYVSSRLFLLGQTSFDHNYSQNLDLQQIYGGGLGWTALKKPNQELDLKGTVQYERQTFLTGGSAADQDLIGSTFSASYLLKLKLGVLTQGIAYIPAWNVTRAYSATETDTFSFPAYKNFSFSVGTLDSYLNDPPASEPPTKRNSFQFTMGVTYAFKSKY